MVQIELVPLGKRGPESVRHASCRTDKLHVHCLHGSWFRAVHAECPDTRKWGIVSSHTISVSQIERSPFVFPWMQCPGLLRAGAFCHFEVTSPPSFFWDFQATEFLHRGGLDVDTLRTVRKPGNRCMEEGGGRNPANNELFRIHGSELTWGYHELTMIKVLYLRLP